VARQSQSLSTFVVELSYVLVTKFIACRWEFFLHVPMYTVPTSRPTVHVVYINKICTCNVDISWMEEQKWAQWSLPAKDHALQNQWQKCGTFSTRDVCCSSVNWLFLGCELNCHLPMMQVLHMLACKHYLNLISIVWFHLLSVFFHFYRSFFTQVHVTVYHGITCYK